MNCDAVTVPFMVVTPSDPGQYYTVTAIPNPATAIWNPCVDSILSTTYTLTFPPVPPPCPPGALLSGMGMGSAPNPGHHDWDVEVRCPDGPPSPTPSPTPTPGPASLEEPLQTTEYPSDAPSYVFDDANAAGGADIIGPSSGTGTASTTRRARQFVRGSGCWGTITINVQANALLPHTVPATYDLQCQLMLGLEPGARPVVDDIFVVTHVYRFNDQGTEVARHEHRVRCRRQLCQGSITVTIPSAPRIVEFEAYFTGSGAVEPESNHTKRRVPFNNSGFAYPEKVDTRFVRQALVPPLPVPFPPGSPSGRAIERCAPNCVPRLKAFKAKLSRAYRNGIWSGTADQSLLGQGDKVEGHHIQELQWGGDNSLENGVLLLQADHAEYTAWWLGA